jgi:hypothetical protein
LLPNWFVVQFLLTPRNFGAKRAHFVTSAWDKSATWRTKDATLPRSAKLVHASNTRLIIFKCLVKSLSGIALHHQVSEIRITGDTDDTVEG